MDTGEWLTRGSIWVALALYVAGELASARSWSVARWLSMLGCAAFLAHVACAFHFHYQWSHTIAYTDTARQTEQFTDWNWGGGLYINYLFALVWLGEVVWLWAKPDSYLQRHAWATWLVRGFFLLMMFNGAVVFVVGNMRWFGLILCSALVICWWLNRKRIVRLATESK